MLVPLAGITARFAVGGTFVEKHVVRSYATCRDFVSGGPGCAAAAASLLPNDVADHGCALHALVRTLRAIVEERDDGHLTDDEAKAGLDFWREWFAAGCWEEIDDPIAPAARYTILSNDVPPELFLELIGALEQDLAHVRYQTMQELAGYCYRSASTSAVAMCYVMAIEERDAQARAAELGVAVQLTAILRDVGHDIGRNRLYLPVEDMARHRVSEAHLRAKVLTRGYRRLMDEMVRAAEAYYDAAFAGLDAFPRKCRRGIRVGANLHRDTLRGVRRNGYDNLTLRAGASAPRLALRAAKEWVGRASDRRTGIPDGLPDGLALIAGAGRPSLTVVPAAGQGSAAS
jgi:phytoene synthase